MRVLVTGTDGYLGCLLAADLLRAGHQVTAVDTGFYREGWLYHGLDAVPLTLSRDIRTLTVEDLRGHDAVVHLAELSNDPLAALAPRLTYEINHQGSVRLARLAREAGIERFVYMSSCSVYGAADGEVDETSPVNPLTPYAECKVSVERDLTSMAGDDFSPTFMRNATAYGASPRMRFDIVLNNLCGLAWTTRRIAMVSDGTPWRPLVHALDISQAIRLVLQAPREDVHAEAFNVGDSRQNYRVKEIADIVATEFPGCTTSFGELGGDQRSYRVSFDKIADRLPGFACQWDAERGARQLHRIFSAIAMDEATFTGRGHTRLLQLQHLISTGQVDPDLYWAHPRVSREDPPDDDRRAGGGRGRAGG